MKAYCLATQIKATEQYFHVVVFEIWGFPLDIVECLRSGISVKILHALSLAHGYSFYFYTRSHWMRATSSFSMLCDDVPNTACCSSLDGWLPNIELNIGEHL